MDTSTNTEGISPQTDLVDSTVADSLPYTTDGVANLSVAAGDSEFKSHVEYQIARWILLVYRPSCGVIGVTGNIMCIVVVMMTSLRNSPTAVYMVTLAVLDWVLSVFSLLTAFAKDAFFGEELYFQETWHCRTHYFFLLFIAHFDTLTLVCMTAQRYVAVRFPLQAARWNTRHGAAFVLTLAAVVAFLANLVHLLTFSIQPYNGQYRGRCDVGTGLGQYVQMRVYPWIDFVLYFLFPTVAMSMLNVLMVHAIRSSGRFKMESATQGHIRGNVLRSSDVHNSASRYSDLTSVKTISTSNGSIVCSLTNNTGLSESSLSSSIVSMIPSSANNTKQMESTNDSHSWQAERVTSIFRHSRVASTSRLYKDESDFDMVDCDWSNSTHRDACELNVISNGRIIPTPDMNSSNYGHKLTVNDTNSRLNVIARIPDGPLQYTSSNSRYNEIDHDSPTSGINNDSPTSRHNDSPKSRQSMNVNDQADDKFTSDKPVPLSPDSLEGYPRPEMPRSPSSQITRMLLTVSIAFLICTLPIGVFVVVSRYWNPPFGYEKALFNLFRDITESLMYTNHAVNFVLYCLAGGRFRAKAASIIFRRTCGTHRGGPPTRSEVDGSFSRTRL